jgi:hypothetical protein
MRFDGPFADEQGRCHLPVRETSRHLNQDVALSPGEIPQTSVGVLEGRFRMGGV